ncbi:hypothetical protein VMCG_03098 [Cytospora schulzeri]|uniref:Major facilitator superfamily (MFS) profile domain-containing protein n=1 Tax=Cytospora schulzeri TaxID=448051 RepID=A0A423WY29_9PEZI|nr:hypothetical protein VMCG_03098 [Valsa malicola]
MASTSSSTAPKGARPLVQNFNLRLLYSCSLVAISQINFGLDQGVFSNTQAMTAFTHKFGEYKASTGKYALEATYLSLLNGLPYVGFAFGLASGNYISRRFGRRICIFTMCMWALIAAIILVTSNTKAQLLVGRVIAYIYIGMSLAVVPVLQSELVPAPVRGLVVGTYQSGLLVGTLIAAVVCRRTSTLQTESSFRIPLGLMFIVPAILSVGIWYMPESPRWLLLKNRPDEALASLRLLRQGRFSDEEIKEELNQSLYTIEGTSEKGSFKELAQGSNLKRTFIVIGVNIFLQITGSTFVSLYGTIFIKSLNTINAFTMTSINSAISICTTILAQFLTDVTGRVPLMFAGATIQTCGLFTMGALGTVSNPSMAVKEGITAMVTVFAVGFQLGWAPLSHVVAAEIPTTRLRDSTYAIGAIFNITIQCAVAFATPYLLNAPYADLGSKVGFIYGSFAFLAMIFTYFCIPECKGKTLEEIDALFLDGVPIRQFRETRPRLTTGDLTKLESARGSQVEVGKM